MSTAVHTTIRDFARIDRACSKDLTRYALNGAMPLCAPTKDDPNGGYLVATDGRMLAASAAEIETTPDSPKKPVSAFKDEAGYTINYDDGSHEESPVQTLVHLRAVARDWGMVLVRAPKADRDGCWHFQPRRGR